GLSAQVLDAALFHLLLMVLPVGFVEFFLSADHQVADFGDPVGGGGDCLDPAFSGAYAPEELAEKGVASRDRGSGLAEVCRRAAGTLFGVCAQILSSALAGIGRES